MEGPIGLFDANVNRQSVSMAAEFAGNFLGGGLTVVFSGGTAIAR